MISTASHMLGVMHPLEKTFEKICKFGEFGCIFLTDFVLKLFF